MNNEFKTKMMVEVSNLENKFFIDTKLKCSLNKSISDREVFNHFNIILNIENKMEKIHNLIDGIYDRLEKICPKILLNILKFNRSMLKIRIGLVAPKCDYDVDILINMIESECKSDHSLINKWIE